MSSDQHQIPQQIQSHADDEPKLMTQSEYLAYKQKDSNANNYYGFSREVDVKPVAWVSLKRTIFEICIYQI